MKYSMSITKGKGNIKHNTRTQLVMPKHVDQDKIEDNIVLVNEDIEEVYKREFGAAIEEYNAKQKRKDRKIDDYYKKILHSKKDKPFHELIIQLGNKDNIPNNNLSNEIYKEFLDEFKKNNPSLKVFSAIIHNDETTPHMHLDYVPVAKKNEKGKGLRLKVSNNKAIKDDGYVNWKDWRKKQEELFENICIKHNINREYMYNTNYHISNVEKYKELARNSDNEPNINVIQPKINKLNKDIKLKLPVQIKLQEPEKTLLNNVKLSDYNANISELNTYTKDVKKAYNKHIKAITGDFNKVNQANIDTIKSLTNALNTARKDNVLIKKENKRLQKSFLNIKNKNDYLLTKDYIIENQELKSINDELLKTKDNDDNQIKLLENQVKELENSNNAKYKFGYNKGYYNAIDELISDENTYNELKELNAFIEKKDIDLDNIDNMILYNDFNIKSEKDIKKELDKLVDTINDKYDNIPNNNLFHTIKDRLANLCTKALNLLTDIKNLLYDKQNQEQTKSNRSIYDEWER